MEKFAGYGFNKAHATAYGIVAYQTAYFKANYPVEFMAALLTSEMANTDKVVVHMDECRAMGIGVLPPDVNVSRFSFGVDGETIRFGLGAIKNLGAEGDRDHRRLARGAGRLRVAGRLLPAARPPARQPAGRGEPGQGRRLRLARPARGPSSWPRSTTAFEAGPAPPARARPGPGLHVRPPGRRGRRRGRRARPPRRLGRRVGPEQRLLNEKEVLGFYLSGHPLRRRLGPRPAAGRRGHRAARPGRGRRARPPLRAGVGAPRDQHEERQPHGLRDHRGRRGHDRGHDLPGAVPAERGAPQERRAAPGPRQGRGHVDRPEAPRRRRPAAPRRGRGARRSPPPLPRACRVAVRRRGRRIRSRPSGRSARLTAEPCPWPSACGWTAPRSTSAPGPCASARRRPSSRPWRGSWGRVASPSRPDGATGGRDGGSREGARLRAAAPRARGAHRDPPPLGAARGRRARRGDSRSGSSACSARSSGSSRPGSGSSSPATRGGRTPWT